MDWLPNIDGIQWFVEEVLPLIRKRRPDCSLVIAGRRPTPDVQRLAERDSRIRVTGTVDDIRPYLWESAVSIVPLRIGGGTRLKIYEAMAAKIPVVSTSIGAEGWISGTARISISQILPPISPSGVSSCWRIRSSARAWPMLRSALWRRAILGK